MKVDTHTIALAASIMITVVAHVVLKIGVGKSRKKINIYNVVGLSGLGLVTILVVYALQVFELKTLMACTALTYFFTPLAAKHILKETVSGRQFVGTLIILLGVTIFFSGR